MEQLPNRYRQFRDEYAETYRAYETLGARAAEAGPLDARTRALIKLGMAAALRAESAVHSHTHRALAIGLTPREIEHAVLLGVTTLGFPAMMSALTWVKEAIATHQTAT